MPSVYNSASSLPIGSRTINANIDNAGVTLVVEGEWAPDKKTRMIERRDSNGDPSDFQLRTERTQFSVTLQRPNSSVNAPNLGAVFVNTTGAGDNYVVMNSKKRDVQGGFGLFDVQLISADVPTN